MSDLRKKLIRLAHSKPELRPHLIPLLKKAKRSWEVGPMAMRALQKAIRAKRVKDLGRGKYVTYTIPYTTDMSAEGEEDRATYFTIDNGNLFLDRQMGFGIMPIKMALDVRDLAD